MDHREHISIKFKEVAQQKHPNLTMQTIRMLLYEHDSFESFWRDTL